MKLTAQIKLTPAEEQHELLKQTLETANSACNSISEVAWESKTFRQFALHKLVYKDTKERFNLSAQVVIRCESKVSDSYKLDKKAKRKFSKHGAISYDSRILKYKLPSREVSIWCMGGRQNIPFQAGEKQLDLLQKQQGESDLILVDNQFYLLATCDIPEPTPMDVEGYLGVDLGIANIATDSSGEKFSGSHLKSLRRRNQRLHSKLQKKGTKGSKKLFKKRSGKETRFASQTNHEIAKRIVDKAKTHNVGIALEELKGIRQRVRVRKSQRSTLHSWAFHDLGNKIEYKAKLAGVPVVFVDPKYTSQQCSKCGHTEKGNRPNQETFKCKSCGHAEHADCNAARNISSRAAVNQPYLGEAKSV